MVGVGKKFNKYNCSFIILGAERKGGECIVRDEGCIEPSSFAVLTRFLRAVFIEFKGISRTKWQVGYLECQGSTPEYERRGGGEIENIFPPPLSRQ